jgi:D-alanyl-D-alanine carboxypeptidase
MKPTVCMLLIAFASAPAVHSQDVRETSRYSKSLQLQSVIDKYSGRELPGVSVAVYTEDEGWWTGSGGYAKVESQTPMRSDHLQYIQSISKTYFAVAILKLREQGLINIDAPVVTYLPASIISGIRHIEKVTVRMLLNHTSGIAEYVSDPEYLKSVLLTPTSVSDMHTVIHVIDGDEPRFVPGTKYAYTNTNYLLLAMILQEITGDHARYIEKYIFTRLDLENTFYRNDKSYLEYRDLVDSYWDLLNTGHPANVSPMQKANVKSLMGDDGIVCTPEDVIKFFRGLFENKLIADTSVNLMKQWTVNDSGDSTYGLGLARIKFGDLIGFGHGGGGIGAGCIAVYFPERKAYIFLATNVGVIWDGLPAIKANELREEIWRIVCEKPTQL